MDQRRRRISSIYAIPKASEHQLTIERSFSIGSIRLTIGNLIGIFLSLAAIVVECVAVFTSNWKEISPKVQSLYIEGVDALIRHDVLVYFNSVHRTSRQTYGLFNRCEYSLDRSAGRMKPTKICTKNFLPSFFDEEFDECHSLEYYRFCSRTNAKIFDVGNDYLRASLGLTSSETSSMSSFSSCDCSYPTYLRACQIFSIFGLVFLILTAILAILFPFLQSRQQRLKAKLVLILSILFGIIFTFVNLIFYTKNLTFETVEYLTGIERHYRFKEIYSLASDVKNSIDRFILSLDIQTGYSLILARIVVVLSLIDGILLMISCKVQYDFSHLSDILRAVEQPHFIKHDENENEDEQTAVMNAEHPSVPDSTTKSPSDLSTSIGKRSSHPHIHFQVDSK